MKIIYSGKRAAPPRADMFLPKWILVSAILLCIISVLNLVLVILMEDWDLFYNVMTDIPIGIILFLCWRNQTIKILDEDTFRYTTFWGKKYIYQFSRIKRIRVGLAGITLVTPKGKPNIPIEGAARVTRPLAEKLNMQLEEQGKKYRVGKSGNISLTIILVLFLILGCVLGFVASSDKFDDTPPMPRTFNHEDMTITLTDDFLNTSMFLGDEYIYDVTYGTDEVSVMVMREPFTLAAGFEEYTVEEYAQLCVDANDFQVTITSDAAGHPYFEYDYIEPEEGQKFHYYAYAYKSIDAFWLIQFAVLDEQKEIYAPQIAQWAASVEFEAGEYVEPPHSGVEGEIV